MQKQSFICAWFKDHFPRVYALFSAFKTIILTDPSEMKKQRPVGRRKPSLRCLALITLFSISLIFGVKTFLILASQVETMNEIRRVTGINGNVVEELKMRRAICEAERVRFDVPCTLKFSQPVLWEK